MNELRQLAEIVTDKRRHSTKIKSARYKKVIQALRADKIASDEDMARLINTTSADNAFRMFKSRLKKKLLRSLLTISLPAQFVNPHNNALLSCVLLQYSVKLLLLLNNRQLATTLAKEGLEKSRQFHFTDLVIYFSSILRVSAGMSGSEREFLNYNSICDRAIATLQAEEQANALVDKLNVIHYRNTVWSKSLLQTAEADCSKVKELKEEFNSFNLNVTYYRMLGRYNYIRQDYGKALDNWKTFEIYLLSQPSFNRSARIGETLLNQMNCCLFLRKYDEATVLARKCNIFFKKGTPNWFTFMEVHFLLLLYSKQYTKAADTYKKVISNSRFLNLDPAQVERWELFGVYLSFIERYVSQGSVKQKIINERKIKNLLWYVPTQAKDKQGYNVAALLIQVLWFLAQDEMEKVCDRIEALKTYTARYLKEEEYKRSYIFMKMLFTLESADYNYSESHKELSILLDELQSLSEGTSGKLIDGMEVIPYPNLWEIIHPLLKG